MRTRCGQEVWEAQRIVVRAWGQQIEGEEYCDISLAIVSVIQHSSTLILIDNLNAFEAQKRLPWLGRLILGMLIVKLEVLDCMGPRYQDSKVAMAIVNLFVAP